MSLFQKKPMTGSVVPLYTLGLQKSCLVVGLGNPGKEYDQTRHNIGFTCVDALAQALDFGGWTSKKDLKCSIATGNASETRVIVMKPTTFMNLSGEAVQAVMHFYKIAPANVIVIHDELDIPFGQIRTRIGGGSAGHNGIKSLIEHIGEDFGRVRIGIGAETKMDSADFVLAKFSKDEQDSMTQLTKEITAIVTEYLYGAQLSHETRSFIV